MELLRLPLVEALSEAKTVLLAGAGGGYDVFGDLPLYFALRNAGKTVHLANLSFSNFYGQDERRIGEALWCIDATTDSTSSYFAELHLSRWFHDERGEDIPIYCFDRVGAKPITTAYRNLVEHLGGVDAVVLVDGGTDSLMRGDEPDLGTPEEDIASIAAVDALPDIPIKLLACIGFGIDTHHGVCHAYFLEAVAELAREGAYLGAFSLLAPMPEAQAYFQAVSYVHERMFNHPSIVNTSLVSAIEGRFGNYHANYRTEGSELFINPLMSLYWCFHLEAVARRNLYLDTIRGTEDYFSLTAAIASFRARILDQRREWISLPM